MYCLIVRILTLCIYIIVPLIQKPIMVEVPTMTIIAVVRFLKWNMLPSLNRSPDAIGRSHSGPADWYECTR